MFTHASLINHIIKLQPSIDVPKKKIWLLLCDFQIIMDKLDNEVLVNPITEFIIIQNGVAVFHFLGRYFMSISSVSFQN